MSRSRIGDVNDVERPPFVRGPDINQLNETRVSVGQVTEVVVYFIQSVVLSPAHIVGYQ